MCSAPGPGRLGCLAVRRTDVQPEAGVQPAAATPRGWGAPDLRSAYDLPADGGAGRTVAVVVAYDDPAAEDDLAVYRAQYGLPECTTANGCFRKIDQRGGTDYPQPDLSWAGETSLDLDMVSAAAPAARILLVEADSPTLEDVGAAVDQAVAQGARYVSNSYSTTYDDAGLAAWLDAHYNRPGVAMVAASGDSGYGVAYPAGSQYVTAVGGTSLKKDSGTDRGWSETVWSNSYGGPGSGCSAYEPKPAFQTGTGCDTRSVADVAAVADPLTGVAVYQTYGGRGWGLMGGTSAAAPIVAGVYAAAGAPVAGTYPNSYPYRDPSALNDVTSGSNGSCDPASLCTAGTGYDGPTGLGTPDGPAAFRAGPHGEIRGTVTDAAGAPLAWAAVTADGFRTTTDADGHYSLTLYTGSYELTAAAYGYRSAAATTVVVTEGGSVTEDFALDAVPRRTVTGKVTDGSGHGWPLYASITLEGVPGGPVFTDPRTGTYELQLPENRDYTLKVAARYPGYQAVSRDITVGTADLRLDIAVPVDADAATAAGYEERLSSPTEPFDSTTAAPAGWSIDNASGTQGSWDFGDPGHRGNRTGGAGAFAIVDSYRLGLGKHQDASLLTPVRDFTGQASPKISFDTDYKDFDGQSADVDITTDGGATWTTLWRQTTRLSGPAHVEIPLTDYAGAPAAQVRFHFVGTYGFWWAVDNVFFGDRAYAPVPGGLVAGTVTDANTGDGVVGATVTNTDAPEQSAVTAATPDDPHLGDGFYWLFSDTIGSHPFTAAKSKYGTGTSTVRVAADSVVRADQSLEAGQLKFTPAAVDGTLDQGDTGTQKLTVTNTGGLPVTFTLREQPGGLRSGSEQGAPRRLVKGDYSPLSAASRGAGPGTGSTSADTGSMSAGTGSMSAGTGPTSGSVAAGDAWQPVADLPVGVQDNAVASYGGKLYSAFGVTAGGTFPPDLYVYDPASGSWTKRAPAADSRDAPASGFIDGKFYAVGGWSPAGPPDAKLEIYDPSSDTWTTGASSPKPYAGSGSAVLDGRLYVIGGCTYLSCGTTDAYAYDPADDSWSRIAPYPEPVAWTACGGINGVLYCAGGTSADAGSVRHAYAYDPDSDDWWPIADLPTDLWGASYAAADGLLLTTGGVVGHGTALTNQSFAFDPVSGTWSALPNVDAPVFRGGGAPGFYSVGGLTDVFGRPVATAQVLPGYDQVGDTDVTWLSLGTRQVTLAPGQSTSVVVTLDASAAGVTQPGTYTAALKVGARVPYQIPAIPVTLHVDPPKNWGRYAGTVLGDDGAGGTAPLAGASVRIVGRTSTHTLTTAEDGTFALWLDARGAPLDVTVTKDGYRTATARVKIAKGVTTVGDFTLKKAP